jgi:hypothetical protein
MSLVRPDRLRWSDYTRGAPANQLDDSIGDIFVLGPWNEVRALQAASPIEPGLFLYSSLHLRDIVVTAPRQTIQIGASMSSPFRRSTEGLLAMTTNTRVSHAD